MAAGLQTDLLAAMEELDTRASRTRTVSSTAFPLTFEIRQLLSVLAHARS